MNQIEPCGQQQRCSRLIHAEQVKSELQPKEIDLNDLERTHVHVQEMAYGCASTTDYPEQDNPNKKIKQIKVIKEKG